MLFEICKYYFFTFMHRSNIFLHEKHTRTFLLFITEHIKILCFRKFKQIK